MEKALDKAAKDFDTNEQIWIKDRLKNNIDTDSISALRASEFDAMVEKDRKDSLSQIARENDMLTLIQKNIKSKKVVHSRNIPQMDDFFITY